MDTRVRVNNPGIIYFSSFYTAIGKVCIAKSDKGICRISFPCANENYFLNSIPLSKHTGTDIKFQRNDSILKYETTLLKEYFKGTLATFDFPLDMSCGTPFQKKVWDKLLEIPYGVCRSYKWVAEEIGCPRAARAVGMANNRNPLPPVVPCHRVIGSDGKLTGYASGLHIKKQLLEMEYNTIKCRRKAKTL